MSKRQKEWAKEARARLMNKLGGVCIICQTNENLTFDCIEPKGDRHHRMDSSSRMSFYHGEHKLGNLQILCERCNNRKAINEQYIFESNIELDANPF